MSNLLLWSEAAITPRNIYIDAMKIEDWGRMGYREAWDRQKVAVANLLANSDGDERIVMVEHDPVYTLGFHGNAANMLASESMLLNSGVECIRIERGGDITYHGPGQLVVYPIISLHRHHLGVRRYVELLEKSVIETLGAFGIECSCNDSAIGVWIDWDTPRARKICAIGVKISHGVTMHGLALNVTTDLSAFRLINPCGFIDKGVTSVLAETGNAPDMSEVKATLADALKRNLDI